MANTFAQRRAIQDHAKRTSKPEECYVAVPASSESIGGALAKASLTPTRCQGVKIESVIETLETIVFYCMMTLEEIKESQIIKDSISHLVDDLDGAPDNDMKKVTIWTAMLDKHRWAILSGWNERLERQANS